jgi:hypothetical protein
MMPPGWHRHLRVGFAKFCKHSARALRLAAEHIQ